MRARASFSAATLALSASLACRVPSDARLVAGLDLPRPDRAESPEPDWHTAVLGRAEAERVST